MWPSKHFLKRMWSDVRKARKWRGQMTISSNGFHFWSDAKDLLAGKRRE